MPESQQNRRIDSALEMQNAIRRIFSAREKAASQSQYDVGVCVQAVGAARNVFEGIPVKGTATAYGEAVLAALIELRDNYHDPDGEYTSGKAPIGDVCHDVSSLVDDQTPSETE